MNPPPTTSSGGLAHAVGGPAHSGFDLHEAEGDYRVNSDSREAIVEDEKENEDEDDKVLEHQRQR